ncbi:MAG TPA: hypothetical protein VFB08_04460 [Burkholderiales bacterium]|nr:hypothetical protein [Burkholderiales bacterium]
MEEEKTKSERFPKMRHWVLFIGLIVAFAQFYFLSVLVQVYSPPPMTVFGVSRK